MHLPPAARLGAFLLLCCPALSARAEPPQVTSMYPLGLPRGRETDLAIGGRGLTRSTQIWCSVDCTCRELSDPAKEAPRERRFRMVLPEATPPGVIGLRAITSEGASPLRLALIDELPTVPASTNRHERAAAQVLAWPCAVDGNFQSRRLDYYRIQAAQGEMISLEVWARRLGSPADPSLRVIDAQNREIGYSDDTPSLSGDCRLRFRVPAEGDYWIEVRDVRYDGGEEFFYRLRVGDFPFVTVAYPLAVARGAARPVLLVAADAPEPLKQIFGPCDAWGDRLFSLAAGPSPAEVASFGRILVTNGPEQEECETNDTWDQATPFLIPGGMNGQLDRLGDRDCYELRARGGERMVIAGSGREMGSAADLYLRLYDTDGKLLQEVDDTGPLEGRLDYTFPTDGTYRLLVEDLTRAGGLGFVYRLEARRFEPGFAMRLESERFHAPRGGIFVVKVSALRDGFDGPIEVRLEGLPDGCVVENAVIEQGKTETVLRVQLPPSVPPGAWFDIAVVGIGRDREHERRVLATASLAEQLANPRTTPLELAGRCLLTVGEEFPEFFRIAAEAPEIVLAQLVGKAQCKLSVERMNGFGGEVQVTGLELPSGFLLPTIQVAAGKSDATVLVEAPPAVAVGDYHFRLRGQATFQNQPREFTTPLLTLRVVRPLQLHVEAGAEMTVGQTGAWLLRLERAVPLDEDIKLHWRGLPEGVVITPESVPKDAGEVPLTVTIMEHASPGRHRGVFCVAETSVQGTRLQIGGAPLDLLIRQPQKNVQKE